MRPVQAFRMILLIALLISSNAQGADAAKVVVGTDRLFFARPGSKLVTALKGSGQSISQGSALVNYSTQSAEIELPGGHIMTLGPSTTVELTRIEESSPLMITFSHGLLRLRLQPRLRATYPALILSHNAIVGARGSEFMVMGPKNRSLTSVLALEGELSFAAIDHQEFLSPEFAREVTIERRDNDYRYGENRFTPQVNVNKKVITSLDEKAAYVLSRKEAVVVKSGQYSVTLKAFNRVSAPAAISPLQFQLLSLNKALLLKTKMSEVSPLDPNKLTAIKITTWPELPVSGAQGEYNESAKLFRPKSGGLIDLGTGLYSAPRRDASFDNQAQTYLPGPIFTLDAVSGQLIPPATLVPNAAYGFAPKLSTDQTLYNQVRNSFNLGPVLGLRNERGEEISSVAVALSRSELSNRQRLELNVGRRSDTLEVTDSNDSFESEQASSFDLEWTSESNKRWSAYVNVGYSSADYKESGVTQPSKGLFRLGAGGSYLLTSRLAIPVGLRYDQRHFMARGGTPNEKITRMSLPQFYTGAEATLFEAFKGRMSWRAQGLVLFNLEKEKAPLTVDSGFGLKFRTGPMWWHKQRTGFGLFYEVESRGGTTTDGAGSLDQDYSRQIMGVTLAHVF